MATTVLHGFEELRASLEISDLQGEVVSTRQQRVREVVARGMDVLDSFLAGSYMRSTMVAPLSEADIDIFIVLDPKHFQQNGQAPLLDKVKRVLRETYPKTPEISRAGRAVTITFTDFRVDVVPAFYRKGGGYLIPDAPQARWIATDPKQHIEIWTRSNNVHNGNLVPLLKMIKAWNKCHSAILGSFHLEVTVLAALKNVKISNFPSGARFVFDKVRALVQSPLDDPAGFPGAVGHLSVLDLENVRSRLETAYTRAVAAEQFAVREQIQAAFAKWRLIFNGYFPDYG